MRDLPTRGSRTRPEWTRPITNRLTPAIRTLVIAEAVVFGFLLVAKEARPFVANHLALSDGFWAGEPWQVVTALFVHLDALSFAFNVIGLWFLGATIERSVGTSGLLQIFFLAGIAGNAVACALAPLTGPVVIAGSGFSILAMFVSFGRVFGRTESQVLGGLFLPARTLAAIMVGIAVVAYVMYGRWAELGGLIAAGAIGYALAVGGVGTLVDRFRLRRVRRRYQVIEGGRSSERPKYLN